MGREQDQKLVEAYERVIREAYTKGFKVGDKFIYQGDNKHLKGKKGVVTEVGVGQIKFQFDHLKKDQEKTLETEGMLKSKAWKKLSESINEGKKRYREQHGIGKAKYTVSFHDGKKKHPDGSDFFGMKIFKNKKALNDFIAELKKDGYLSESINEFGMVIGTPLTRRGEATPTQEAMNPKDKTGEREGYYLDTVNRGVRLMEYGVLSKAEYKKVKDFMKKTITF